MSEPRTRPWLALGCAVAAAAVYAAAPPPDLLRAGLALFMLIGALWMTQALPLATTALLVPLLAVLGGIQGPHQALGAFAHPVIFLFLGGFALAAALQQQGLDRALALAVVRAAGGRRLRAALLLFGMTALVSMWINNTATAALMLPLGWGLLRNDDPAHPIGPREKAFVLLGVAYSASIGGIGTLVGSPPNAIAAAQAGIGFAGWLRIGLPSVLLLMPLMVLTLVVLLRPRLGGAMALAPEPLPWTRERRLTIAIFGLAALGWVASASLGRALGVDEDMDTLVALAAMAALVAGRTIDWPALERQTPWGVLLLFGGGLALSDALGTSGVTRYLSEALVGAVQGVPVWALMLALLAFVVFLGEFVSNTACAALLVPVCGVAGATLGLPPALLPLAVGVAASCGFMLPVATPPNAMVIGPEAVTQATMMRCGFVLNLVSVAVIAAVSMAMFG